MSDIISGIKLILHNASGVDLPDDTTLPFKLEASFSPPEFMQIAFICLHGGNERIVVRGKTREALEQFVKANNLRFHPRRISLDITGPDNLVGH